MVPTVHNAHNAENLIIKSLDMGRFTTKYYNDLAFLKKAAMAFETIP